jgi:ADP-ribose pyrophosphatase YjhB (NUDIX family)
MVFIEVMLSPGIMREVRNGSTVIIRHKGGIVLIKRKNPPIGWALPSGKLEPEESLEQAAVREAKEETNLDIRLLSQLKTYSDPARYDIWHVITTVFIAEGKGELKAGDDATEAAVFHIDELPPMVWDHRQILMDYDNRDD